MIGRALAVVALCVGLLALPAAAQAAAPTNLRVTDLRASGATLTWTAPPGDVYGYSIVNLLDPFVNNGVGWSFTSPGEADLQPQTRYRLAVRATFIVDGNLVDSPLSSPVEFTTPADTTAPAAPTLRHFSHTTTSVQVGWTGGEDDVGVDAFVITNGSRTWTIPAWQQWWTTLDGLETNRTHTFTVRARDAAGNVSPPSNEVAVLIENVAPSAPQNLRVENGRLAWDPSTDNSGTVVGYRIFFEDTLLAGTTGTSGPLQVEDPVDMELVPPSGTRHTYTVRAVDPSGNASSPSNAVTVVVP
jgi:hypothetical protein